VDEPVEVVRNHEGGASVGDGTPAAKETSVSGKLQAGCAAEGQALDESQERKDAVGTGLGP